MSGAPWPDGPADSVQVWLVPDQRSERVLAELLAVLDAGERLRADACRSADARRRFVVAHGALRHIVAGHLGIPAARIRWRRGPHGKPHLAGRWSGTQVNLSHSGEVAMVAVTASRRVGVDIQRVLPHVDGAAMARRYFPPEEALLVRAALDPAERADRFARLWARKEALVKAHGCRLTQGLRIPVTGPGCAVAEPAGAVAGPPTTDRGTTDRGTTDRGTTAPGDGTTARAPGTAAGPLATALGPGVTADGRTASPRTEDAWSRDYHLTDVDAPPGYRAAVALAGPAGYRVTWHRWTWPGPAPADPAP
ncbi:4'-phosphopantetheinyl transferase superfamily protein [Streptomyces sp. HPF1205]|uniref:4'-phosphopantetheinyl transferase family protein n=1 Tax=Streptomyces sp. HPF1205 TaxID=2873262 RepID=UPI001CECD309|nr:4'-phosphopantetheinyl transferase superfamily protein [Streptomyces sp. HPF1205]